MKSDRRSRDLAVALFSAVVAIICAVALSVGADLQHNKVAAHVLYPSDTEEGSSTTGSGPLGRARMVGPFRATTVPSCPVPTLPGTVVDVTLTDMHAMMGPGGMMGPGYNGSQGRPMGVMRMMRIVLNPATVPPGEVSFRVTNAGALNHELVILPLANGQYLGQRAIGPDGKVDEVGSRGEAARTCGTDEGDEDATTTGITPGASGWTTVELTPGRYELICNISGHYWTGMYTELDVSPSR